MEAASSSEMSVTIISQYGITAQKTWTFIQIQ